MLAADEAHRLGPPPPAESYMRGDRIIEIARATGAEGIHPGYGFLAENADFAAACEAATLTFIGPTPEQMRAFGLKHTARALAAANGVPLLPGTDLLRDVDEALVAAARIGYPVMLKSTAGGGGIGMRRCADACWSCASGLRRRRAPRRAPTSSRPASTSRSLVVRARATSRSSSSATATTCRCSPPRRARLLAAAA